MVLQAADNRGIVRTKLRGKPIGIAVIQKNSGIVKMVTALSGLLKNMAKGFNEKVTLKKELEFLNDYVTIEKVKYVELFDLETQVDDPGLYEAEVFSLWWKMLFSTGLNQRAVMELSKSGHPDKRICWFLPCGITVWGFQRNG